MWSTDQFVVFRQYTDRILVGLAHACGRLLSQIDSMRRRDCDGRARLTSRVLNESESAVINVYDCAMHILTQLQTDCARANTSERLVMCQMLYQEMDNFHARYSQGRLVALPPMDTATSTQLAFQRSAELSAAVGNYCHYLRGIEVHAQYHHLIVHTLMYGLLVRVWAESTLHYGLLLDSSATKPSIASTAPVPPLPTALHNPYLSGCMNTM
jgi:hypothetical protein